MCNTSSVNAHTMQSPEKKFENQIEELMNDRDAFNSFIYTPWEEALSELKKRSEDTKILDCLSRTTPHGIPEIMEGKKSMVLFRHIATPNYEIRRFTIAADALSELHPIILEYTDDQFNNRNDWKFSLGKLYFQKGFNKLGEPVVEKKTIIDINAANNQPISSLATKWGQSLVDFHHELLTEQLPHVDIESNVFDLSSWLHKHGVSAREYYKAFLSLFLKDGILFENFLIDSKEYGFTKDIILPAILELEEETGYRPLIVALEPTHIEGDDFWLSHPSECISAISGKLSGQ